MIETDLRTYLVAQVASAGGRVYPAKLPQNPTYPCITYFQVSGPRDYSHDGYSGTTASRYQVSCWGKTYAATKGLAREVIRAVEGYTGMMGTTRIGLIRVDNETDNYEYDSDVYHMPVDLIIQYKE